MATSLTLSYQTDSFKRTTRAHVLSCEQCPPLPSTRTQHGGVSAGQRYVVQLSDTVIFPEGGGQPDDRGQVGQAKVLKSWAEGGKVLHLLDAPLACGEEVEVTVDWRRRFDHMQQHSGQHLLSAVAEQPPFGLDTLSWSLGDKVCSVELRGSDPGAAVLEAIEESVNAKIRAALDVSVVFLDSQAPGVGEAQEGQLSRKGIPAGAVGPTRLVHIAGVDRNLCCGTHVANTAQIQALKLLSIKTVHGNTRVFFVAGLRVLASYSAMLDREAALTKLLSCGPDDHAAAVQKNLAAASLALKQSQAQQKELATLLAEQLLRREAVRPLCERLVCVHRDTADPVFSRTLVAAAKDQAAVFVSHGRPGGAKQEGSFVLCGPSALLAFMAPRVTELLHAKIGKSTGGAGKDKSGDAALQHEVLQGQASNLRPKVLGQLEQAIRTFLAPNASSADS